MKSTSIRHLRESLALLPMEGLAPVSEFYRRLFELAPEVRLLFKRDMDLQAKKFSETLAWVIAHLEHRQDLCQELRELGARHSAYGVKIEQYAPVGSALIWMFQRTLGVRFTPKMEEARLEFYAFASLEMERGFSANSAAARWDRPINPLTSAYRDDAAQHRPSPLRPIRVPRRPAAALRQPARPGAADP